MRAAELDAVFAERAALLGRAGNAGDESSRSTLLSFSHADRSYAVELSSVLRVLRPRRLTRIPSAPHHLDRVFHEAGRIVAALDPSALFGAPVTPDGKELIVLLIAGEHWLGVRASRVLGPRPFAMDRLAPTSVELEAGGAQCVRGIAKDLTIVMDGEQLVRSLLSRREDA